MKIVSRILLVVMILLSCNLYSQQDVSQQIFPNKRLRVGFVFTDLVSNRFRMDLDYRVAGPQVVTFGLGLLYGNEDMDNRIIEEMRQPLHGFFTNLGYKYYYAANRSGHTFHFVRVSGSYQNANVTYYGYGFVEFEEDGLTYLNYQEVEKFYNAQTLGLQGEIGFEFQFDPFFMELAFGMQYRRKISDDELPSTFISGGRPFDIDYTGVAPTLAYKLGIYLD